MRKSKTIFARLAAACRPRLTRAAARGRVAPVFGGKRRLFRFPWLFPPLRLPRLAFVVAVDPEAPPPGLEGAVIAIGNFDGVHRGHVAVLKRAEAVARRLGRPCAVLTFEPHPADFFFRTDTIFRLTPQETKAVALARAGVEGMIVLTFDAALAAMPAEDFVREILVRRLKVGGVVAGYDFHFGKGRLGTPAFLVEAGRRYGFAVEIVERIAADSERLDRAGLLD